MVTTDMNIEIPVDNNGCPLLSTGQVIKSPGTSYLSKVVEIEYDGLFPKWYRFVMCTGKTMFLLPSMLLNLKWVLVNNELWKS
jgi:hypothetical protein